MTTRFDRAKAYEKDVKKMLEQFLDKRRVDVADAIMGYLIKPQNQQGVPQKRIVDDIHAKYNYNPKRIYRTTKDLLRVGLIRDVGAKRTTRIYVLSPDYCSSSLSAMSKNLNTIQRKAKSLTKKRDEK